MSASLAVRVQWSPVAELDAPQAIQRTRAVTRAVEQSQQPWVVTTLVTGNALVMGALQREKQVRWRYRDLGVYPAEARATTGVSLLVTKSAIQQLIVVPGVNTLHSDAHAGNFINRTVRGFLRAYNGCGAKAHYFGREHFTLSRRPAGVLGLDVTSGGGWVLEAWVGVEAAAPLDEFNGHAPIGLREALKDAGSKRAEDSALELAERLHERLRGAFEVPAAEEASVEPPKVEPEHEESRPEDFDWAEREVPIGLIELGRRRLPNSSFEYRVGGDVLTGVAAARRFAARLADDSRAEATDEFHGVPFEGARLGDLDVTLWRFEDWHARVPSKG